MAGSKKRVDHVAWQIEVTNNEEWEELIRLPGLVVVDVYSEWCGPCQAMASHLKEIKLQLGDDLLHCALAKADGITQLAKFRGRSEPTWLFLAGGEPVAVIRGANAPLVRKTLLAELEAEKQVMAETRQRSTLVWEKIEFPKNNPEEEDQAAQGEESNAVPVNWSELDGLVLSGTNFRSVIDPLVSRLSAYEPTGVQVARRTYSRLEATGECVVLWLNTAPLMSCHDIDEESRVHRQLAEMLEDALKTIQEERTAAIEQLARDANNGEEDASVKDSSPPPEGAEPEKPTEEEEANQEEGAEPAEDKEETAVSGEPEEVPVIEPIQFRLYFDPMEKEELVEHLKAAAERPPEEPAAPVEEVHQNEEATQPAETATIVEPVV